MSAIVDETLNFMPIKGKGGCPGSAVLQFISAAILWHPVACGCIAHWQLRMYHMYSNCSSQECYDYLLNDNKEGHILIPQCTFNEPPSGTL